MSVHVYDVQCFFLQLLTMWVLVVQDTSLNLLFAGHDTSASAIMLAVRHLKIHPEVLITLRQEQQQVSELFSSHGSYFFPPLSLSLPLPLPLPFPPMNPFPGPAPAPGPGPAPSLHCGLTLVAVPACCH